MVFLKKNNVKNQLLLSACILFLIYSCKQKQEDIVFETNTIKIDSIEENTTKQAIYDAFYKSFDRRLIDNQDSDTIENTHIKKIISKKDLDIYSIEFSGYFEFISPYRFFFPYKDSISNQIEFIIASYQDYGEDYPVVISFLDKQLFTFGRNYTLLTERMKESDNLDTFNENSFYDPNFLATTDNCFILKTKNKKYLLFTFNDKVCWYTHHLFDITNSNNIKYYILYSLYTIEDGYFVDKDGKLKFRQKYFYLRNSEDTSQDKYRIIDIP